jgi:isoleucyl-tRNA synthetase
MQMPLKQLIIFHHDQEYLDDVKSLETYLSAELNITEVVYTSDESAVGIKYKATADFAVLGKKLRKDFGKVRTAIPAMSSDACKAYLADGKATLNGVDLVQGDLFVSRSVAPELAPGDLGDEASFATEGDGEVIILLDIRKHADLESLALLRSLTARVNKLRKEAGLKPTDKVDVLYAYDEGEEDALSGAIEGNEEYLEKAIGGVPARLGMQNEPVEGREIETEKRAKSGEALEKEERYVLTLASRV